MRRYKAFLAMLKKAGVIFKVLKRGLIRTVIVKSCAGPANEGYGGLYTAFVFRSGDLLSVGAWDGA